MAKKIFFSYSHRDSDVVEWYYDELTKKGYDILMDRSFSAGVDWKEKAYDYVIECSISIIFISKNSLISKPVYEEMSVIKEFNEEENKPYFAINLDAGNITDKLEALKLLDVDKDDLRRAYKMRPYFPKDNIYINHSDTVLDEVIFSLNEYGIKPSGEIIDTKPKKVEIKETKVEIKPTKKTIRTNDYIYEGYVLNEKRHGIGKCSYNNGNYYEGSFVNDKIEGYGEMRYNDGGHYKGEWYNDCWNGKGSVVYTDGSTYEGGFKNNLRHGFGKHKYKDSTYYEGEFKDGKKHGKGKQIYADGIYEGSFINDVREGYGICSYYDGGHYSGEWSNDCWHGNGKVKYNDGNIYEGHLKYYAREGYGEMTYTNGAYYAGNWKDNNWHGKGKIKYSNGSIYEGDINMGVVEGYGVCKYNDGTKYTGSFKADKWHGKGKIEYTNGVVYDGDFDNNVITGKGKCVYNPNQSYEGDWKNGERHGYGVFVDLIAFEVYSGEYKNNKKHGNGTLELTKYNAKAEGVWKDDKAISFSKVYVNGKLKYEGHFISVTKLWGHGKEYNDKGKIRYLGYFQDGRYMFRGVLFFDSSDLLYKDYKYYDGEFVYGVIHGKGEMHKLDGSYFVAKFDSGRIPFLKKNYKSTTRIPLSEDRFSEAWHIKEANEGYRTSMLILARGYRDGAFGYIDYDKSIKWYEKALKEEEQSSIRNELNRVISKKG